VLSFDDFRPVTLEDRDFFRQFYARYPQVHSDNTFTNMMCWNHYASYSFANVGDNVILASRVNGKTRFRPPMGPQNPALMKDLVRLAAEVGDAEQIILIDPDTADWIRSIYPRIELMPDRDQAEYVYRADDLAKLQGRDYLYIRREINKYRRTYTSSSVEPISSANCDQINKYLDKWYTSKDQDNGIAGHEKEAIKYSLDNMEELGLSGLAIRVDGQIGAMSIFERMNPDTALIHFEKGLPEYEGIYKVINQETAALLSQEYEFINRESDLGVPGLREAKMRYHPHHMVEVYSATRPKIDCKLHCYAKRTCNVKCCTS